MRGVWCVVRVAWLVLALVGAVGESGAGAWPADRASGQTAPDDPPLVLAFYYNWFDENTWSSGKAADLPVTPYNSRDRATIERHVAQAQSAGIDAFAVGWYGPPAENNQTETNLALMLDVADATGFRVTVEYGPDSPFVHSQGDVVDALRYALDVHARHPGWLRYEGKPVIVFWRLDAVPTAPGQSPLDAWRAIRDQVDPGHDTVWIAEGTDVDYLDVFDGHHLYSIAWSPDVGRTLDDWGYRVRRYNRQHGTDKLWVATVMPGYDDTRLDRPDAFARDREDGDFYRQCWQAAEASQPDWVIVTSWNEWLEGSHIEPSQQYGDLYLDLTRELAAGFKGQSPAPLPAAAGSVAAPSPSPTAAPSPTPVPPPSEPTPGQANYTVRNGDTLSQIAERFGVPMAALMEANGLTDPDHIRIGQVLVITAPAETPEPTSPSAPVLEPTPRSEPSPEPLPAATEFVPPTVGPTVVVPPTVGPTEVSGTGVTPPPTASSVPSLTATPAPPPTTTAVPTPTPVPAPLAGLAPRLSGVLLCVGLGGLAGAASLLGLLVWLWARGR